MPEANRLTVGVLALIAEHEREAISKRTREALAAAKARGRILGNPNGAAALRRAGRGNAASLDAIRAKADKHAENLRPVIEQLRAQRVNTLGGIAKKLNVLKMRTPRGGSWHKASVRNLLGRLASRDPAAVRTP